MNILQKITSVLSSSSTYSVGKLQANAYAILTKRTTEALEKYGISPKEWALLGLLYERASMRPSDIAHELGVEAAYVTAMATHLKKLNYIQEEIDTHDTRAKILCVTAQGKVFIKKTEPVLRTYVRPLLKGVAPRDVVGYIIVLEHIIKNDTNH